MAAFRERVLPDDDACEWAWESASVLLDGEAVDAPALAVLIDAAERLALCADDRSRTRRAMVLEGVALCHEAADDAAAAARVALELFDGTWPAGALLTRLGAAATAVAMSSAPFDEAIVIAERAIAVGEGSEDDECRALVAWHLKWLAGAVARTSEQRRRALLTRVIDEFADVDSALDSAVDRLADPYYEGLALAGRPGKVPAAEAAFRRAVDAGQSTAWLDLAITLGAQAGREDDEEQALRAAIDAEALERSTYASYLLGCLLHFARDDRAGARAAFGAATTGTGEHAVEALRELAMLASLDGDNQARGALIAELAGRSLVEWDADARDKSHRMLRAASRLGYARPLVILRGRQWRRRRRRTQRRLAAPAASPSQRDRRWFGGS